MKALILPAFRSNGMAVQLAEIVAVIPENNLVWSILEFYGIGEAPNGLSMDEFEAQVCTKPSGFVMSWQDLKKFANKLNQTIDCVIVGVKSVQDILDAHRARNDFSSCEVVLEAFDSSEWSIWARDAMLMNKFAGIYS